MHKYTYILLLLCSWGYNTSAQSYQWAIQQNYSDQNIAESVGCDKYGNVYVSGRFLAGYHSTAPQGCLISKFNNAGILLWSDTIANALRIYSATNTDGETFVTGYFSGSVTLGTYTLIGTTPPYFQEGFLAKYNSIGQCEWAKPTWGYGIALNPTGGFYTTASNNGLVSKFDGNGNIIWTASASGNCYASTLAIDKMGNVYLSGTFKDTVTIGGISINYNGLLRNNFIAKFDSTGIVEWVNHPTTLTGLSRHFSISIDEFNNLYATCHFSDNISLDTFAFSSPSSTSIIFSKYAPAGNVLWSKAFIGSSNNEAYSIFNDQSGFSYISGGISGSMNLGSGITSTLSTGNLQAFAAKFDLAGEAIWIRHSEEGISDPGNSISYAICKDAINSSIYMTGSISGGDVLFGSVILNTPQYPDLLLCRLDDVAIPTTTSSHEVYSESNSFSVFPNPSSGVFTLSSEIESTKHFICVYDLIGKCILRTGLDSKSLELDISNQAKGIYYIKIIADDKIFFKKIIVQ